jgi:hypothetical protein
MMPIAAPKKKRSLMPVLTIVFLFSYGLMTLLIVEQGAAIQQQHNLIQVLLVDSRELWAMKGKILTDRSAREQAQKNAQSQNPLTHGQVPSVQTPSSNAPSVNTPSTQAQSNQTPSTQIPQQHAQNRGKAAGPKTQAPQNQVPPMPASDLSDRRRVLIAL